MKNRWFTGLSIYFLFNVLMQTPFGWLSTNLFFAVASVWEYSDIQRGILLKVHESDRSCDQIDKTQKVL